MGLLPGCGCHTTKYMSSVMTVRLNEDLLAQIKAAARGEARSVSAYVLRVLEEHLAHQAEVRVPPTKAKKSAMGSLRHLAAPEGIEDFRAARRETSRSVDRGLRGTAQLLARK